MDDFEIVAEGLTFLELVGRLHPAAVHLPVAATMILLAHETAAYFGVRGFRDSSPYYVIGTLLSYMPAIATGWLRADEFASDALGDIFAHRNFMLLAFGLLIIMANWRLAMKRITLWYLSGLVAVCAVMAYAADLGGALVYGADYFSG